MTALAIHSDVRPSIKPDPRIPIAIRVATLDDIEFIDGLQKLSSKALGFLPFDAIKGHIEKGDVLIAEGSAAVSAVKAPSVNTNGNGQQTGGTPAPPKPLGYIIGRDSYYRNETCGYISQLNVHPDYRRHLIGAKLVEALFQRAAYGCRLYACWCAQDLPANRFWESLGFVPIAFRTGSEKKQRIHIFWQKRVREDECRTNTGETPVPLTPYWYPSKTEGGQIREDRVSIPIPPGTHWSDAKPMIVPGVGPGVGPGDEVPMYLPMDGKLSAEEEALKALPNPRKKRAKKEEEDEKAEQGVKFRGLDRSLASSSGLRCPIPEEIAKQKEEEALEAKRAAARKAKRERTKRKFDPRFLEKVREFRDRFLESAHMEGGEWLLAEAKGKYDVSRQLEAAPTHLRQTPLLDAA